MPFSKNVNFTQIYLSNSILKIIILINSNLDKYINEIEIFTFITIIDQVYIIIYHNYGIIIWKTCEKTLKHFLHALVFISYD